MLNIAQLRHAALAGLLALSLTLPALAQDVHVNPDDVKPPKPEYSPYLERNYPDRVFWGDTHVHTSYSADAGMIGNRLGPDEAYRFAKGEEVTSSIGVRARLARPLDFLVVTDHAENLGLAPMIAESNPDLLKTAFGRKVHDLVKGGKPGEAYATWGGAMAAGNDPLKGQDALTRSIWARVTEAAERHNQPGRFTAFIGFEWTSSPGGNNLHRNIIFRDGKDKADQILPFSAYDSADPEDLWQWMATYEQKTGGRLLAIPHNGNLSNGHMFDVETLTTRQPLDRDYAVRRMRWEPLYEVTQMKGDGETHPSLSPSDEFANFERWDKGSFGPQAKTPDMLPREYAREALKRGLAYAQQLGANPFKFGLVGARTRTRPCPRRPRTISSARRRRPSRRRIRPASRRKSPGTCRIRKARTSPSGIIRPRPPAWRGCGRRRIPVRPCGTPCSARKSMRLPARVCSCGSSLAGTSRPTKSTVPTSPSRAISAACPWAGISSRRLRARPRPS